MYKEARNLFVDIDNTNHDDLNKNEEQDRGIILAKALKALGDINKANKLAIKSKTIAENKLIELQDDEARGIEKTLEELFEIDKLVTNELKTVKVNVAAVEIHKTDVVNAKTDVDNLLTTAKTRNEKNKEEIKTKIENLVKESAISVTRVNALLLPARDDIIKARKVDLSHLNKDDLEKSVAVKKISTDALKSAVEFFEFAKMKQEDLLENVDESKKREKTLQDLSELVGLVEKNAGVVSQNLGKVEAELGKVSKSNEVINSLGEESAKVKESKQEDIKAAIAHIVQESGARITKAEELVKLAEDDYLEKKNVDVDDLTPDEQSRKGEEVTKSDKAIILANESLDLAKEKQEELLKNVDESKKREKTFQDLEVLVELVKKDADSVSNDLEKVQAELGKVSKSNEVINSLGEESAKVKENKQQDIKADIAQIVQESGARITNAEKSVKLAEDDSLEMGKVDVDDLTPDEQRRKDEQVTQSDDAIILAKESLALAKKKQEELTNINNENLLEGKTIANLINIEADIVKNTNIVQESLDKVAQQLKIVDKSKDVINALVKQATLKKAGDKRKEQVERVIVASKTASEQEVIANEAAIEAKESSARANKYSNAAIISAGIENANDEAISKKEEAESENKKSEEEARKASVAATKAAKEARIAAEEVINAQENLATEEEVEKSVEISEQAAINASNFAGIAVLAAVKARESADNTKNAATYAEKARRESDSVDITKSRDLLLGFFKDIVEDKGTDKGNCSLGILMEKKDIIDLIRRDALEDKVKIVKDKDGVEKKVRVHSEVRIMTKELINLPDFSLPRNYTIEQKNELDKKLQPHLDKWGCKDVAELESYKEMAKFIDTFQNSQSFGFTPVVYGKQDKRFSITPGRLCLDKDTDMHRRSYKPGEKEYLDDIDYNQAQDDRLHFMEFGKCAFEEKEGDDKIKSEKIFNDTNLFKASFRNCTFKNVDFSEVSLDDLKSINFLKCQFVGDCIFPAGTTLDILNNGRSTKDNKILVKEEGNPKEIKTRTPSASVSSNKGSREPAFGYVLGHDIINSN